MNRLENKRIVITGGSRGLGRAIALACVSEGASVAFTYVKNEEAATDTRAKLEALAKEQVGAEKVGIEKIGTENVGTSSAGSQSKVLAFRTEAHDAAATDVMVRAVEQAWGGIDILINNAGVTQNLPLALMEEDDFDHVMRVNTKSMFITSRAVLRGMIRRKAGVIVNIGSLVGLRMMEAPIHYCTSKAAVVGLTQALAKEVARHGIRVVCLAPGLLEDGMGRNLPEHRLADYLRHCALGRIGSFEEVAEACVFLASDDATYIHGATLIMDGGV